jgi:serine/threonine protein phosphatase PrpC
MDVFTRVVDGGRNEDRIHVAVRDDRVLIVVADGAGGTSAASETAEAICEATREFDDLRVADSDAWCNILRQLDVDLARIGGQSTVVVVELIGNRMFGASVGDSEAWVVSEEEVLAVTSSQRRKPLMGNGTARPAPLAAVELQGCLLVATDGLFKYARRQTIIDVIRANSGDNALTMLVKAASLPGGKLQDDIAIVLCQAHAHEP